MLSVYSSEKSIKLLGFDIDKLSFDEQVNAISRLHKYLGCKEKEFLINGFFYAIFNYCALIRHLCSANSVRKIEQSQTRALRIFRNGFDIDYKTLLDKPGKCTMEVKRLITLRLEVFKALNNLNPAFIEEIFHRTKWLTHRWNNIQVNVHKTAKHGDKSLRILGPYIWNSLQDHMKAGTNFIKFR